MIIGLPCKLILSTQKGPTDTHGNAVVKRGFFQTDLLATGLGHGVLLTNHHFAKGLSGVGEHVNYMGVLYICLRGTACQIHLIRLESMHTAQRDLIQKMDNTQVNLFGFGRVFLDRPVSTSRN
jgi:hypothetical protein